MSSVPSPSHTKDFKNGTDEGRGCGDHVMCLEHNISVRLHSTSEH